MTERSPLLRSLRELAERLDASGFLYAVVGAFARNAWARPRATTDADLALALPEARVAELRALFADAGLEVRKERRTPPDPVPELLLLQRVDDPMIRIDVLVACTPFEDGVLARRAAVDLGDGALWVASPEDVIVYKLVAGRPRDYADADEVAEARRLGGTPVDWDYVERWCREFGVGDRATDLRGRRG